MSIDELYKFCLKNNFAHFDSNEFGKELMVRMNGNFEKTSKDEDKHKESLTPFVSRAFHDHVNLNKSEISETSFSENVPSANFRPILAHICTNSDNELDFGSHDYYVTTDKDGNDKVVYEEQPIGVIDGTKTVIEYDENAGVNRAVLHGYLYDEYCQDAIEILNRRGTVDCSIELCIRELSFNNVNKTLLLDDFYVSGLTLLSKDVLPGMAGSNFKIEDFAINAETATFSTDKKLVETLEKLTNILEGFDINRNSKKGGTNNDMTKFEELLAKYGKTVEDVTFDYAGMSNEELEAKFAEVFKDDNSDNGESGEPSKDGEGFSKPEENTDKDFSKGELFNKLFEISFDEIRYALNALCSIYRNDSEWCYVSQIYEDYFIMEDWDSNKFYKQSYTKDGDNVTLSGERIEMFAMLLTESEKISIEEMRSNYATLKEFKDNAEKNELHAKREKILASEKYEAVSETEAFKELVKNMDNYSLEDLEKEAKIIFADNLNIETFALRAENVQKKSGVKMFANMEKSKKDNRYGNLFSK